MSLIRTLKALTVLALVLGCTGTATAAKPGSGGAPTHVPMTFADYLPGDPASARSADIGCLTNDIDYHFSASGSLAPGEFFTFTIMPTCAGWNERPVIQAHMTWDASQIELSTAIPATDPSSGTGVNDIGLPLVARPFGKNSHSCVFIAPWAAPGNLATYRNVVDTGTPASDWISGTWDTPNIMGVGVTYTIRNVGSETAYKVQLSGTETNGWAVFWSQWAGIYEGCHRADGDGDGWNDALEKSLYAGASASPGVPRGTNFALTLPAPADPFNGGVPVAAYPPDFDNDGIVDQLDLDLILSYAGQGTGIPYAYLDWYWETGRPLPPLPPSACQTCPTTGAWRRFDLNNDGFVDNKDVALEELVIGQPYPPENDILPPSVRMWSPWNGGTVTVGQYTGLQAIATDNLWLAKTEFYVNGRLIVGNAFTPKRGGAYTIMAKAYDAMGNTATDTIQVTAQ